MADLAISPSPAIAASNPPPTTAASDKPDADAFTHLLAAAGKPVVIAAPVTPDVAAAIATIAGEDGAAPDGKTAGKTEDAPADGSLDPALVALLASLAPPPAPVAAKPDAPATAHVVAATTAGPEGIAPPAAGQTDAAPVSPEKQAQAQAALAAFAAAGIADPATETLQPRIVPKPEAAPAPITQPTDAPRIAQAAIQADVEQGRRDRALAAPRSTRTRIAETTDALASTATPSLATQPTTALDGTALLPNPADGMVDRAIAGATDAHNLDMLTRDIAATTGADARLSFRLSPEHLGGVSVHIAQGAEGASVRMHADDDRTRAIIADAQPRLAAEARAQGLTLRETSVDVGSGNARGGGQPGFGDGQTPQQRQAASDRSSPDDNIRRPMVAAERARPGAAADARYA